MHGTALRVPVRTWALVLVLAALAAACTPADRPVAVDGPSLGEGAALVDVVVVLDPSVAPGPAAANRARAEEIARDLGATPRFAYGRALFGFAASVPEARIAALERDPRVRYVQRDRVFRISMAVQGRCPSCGGGGGGEIGRAHV